MDRDAAEEAERDQERPVRHAVKAAIDGVRIRKLASSYVLLETKLDPNRLELDSPVPPNLYAAVAQVIAFIYKLKGRQVS